MGYRIVPILCIDQRTLNRVADWVTRSDSKVHRVDRTHIEIGTKTKILSSQEQQEPAIIWFLDHGFLYSSLRLMAVHM